MKLVDKSGASIEISEYPETSYMSKELSVVIAHSKKEYLGANFSPEDCYLLGIHFLRFAAKHRVALPAGLKKE